MDAAAQDMVRGMATTYYGPEGRGHCTHSVGLSGPEASGQQDSESPRLDREDMGSRSRPIMDKLGFAGTFQA